MKIYRAIQDLTEDTTGESEVAIKAVISVNGYEYEVEMDISSIESSGETKVICCSGDIDHDLDEEEYPYEEY